jgi:hypothetical protein
MSGLFPLIPVHTVKNVYSADRKPLLNRGKGDVLMLVRLDDLQKGDILTFCQELDFPSRQETLGSQAYNIDEYPALKKVNI